MIEKLAPIIGKAVIGGVFIATAIFGKGYIETDRIYSLSTVVVAIEDDEVIVETFTGNQSAFYGAEDWMVGDIAALTIDNMGTPDDITDDRIINARYCGYVS